MVAATNLKINFLAITHRPIVAKFCMRKHNGMLTRATGQKMQMCKIQDGGRPPFWKSLNRYIWVKNCPISMKSGTLHQILNPVTVNDQKLKFFKFQMAAAAILKIDFLAITHRPIVRFQRNFAWGATTRATWQKLQIFKIQDGGRPPFWKSLNRHIWVKIVRFWWNLDHYIKYWTRLQSRDQKLKF